MGELRRTFGVAAIFVVGGGLGAGLAIAQNASDNGSTSREPAIVQVSDLVSNYLQNNNSNLDPGGSFDPKTLTGIFTASTESGQKYKVVAKCKTAAEGGSKPSGATGKFISCNIGAIPT